MIAITILAHRLKGIAFHKRRFDQAYDDYTKAGAYWNPTMKVIVPASGDKRDYLYVSFIIIIIINYAGCDVIRIPSIEGPRACI